MEYRMGSFGILDLSDLEENPLVLIDGGIEARQSGNYYFDNERRKEYHGYLFQYTLRGSGCYEKNGKCFEVKAGEGFLVSFPEKSRYYFPKKKEEKWEFIYLHFDGAMARPFVEKINQLAESPFSLNLYSPPVEMALSLQKKLTGGGRLKKYEGGEFLYRFLCALLRELENPSCKNENGVIEDAVRIMEEEYGTLESVESLADRLGLSFAHFSRSFKERMGAAPITYLTRIRLQGAMNDLLNTEEGLQAIAEKNGFSGRNYFCKVFRKVVGVTPTEYRRRR